MTHPVDIDPSTLYRACKPRLPYVVGQELWVCSHIPAAPARRNLLLTPATKRERLEMTPLQRCIIHPPQPGSIGDAMLLLKLVKEIRVGDKHSAQLMAVNVLQTKPGDSSAPLRNITMVAKFYDPLYYDHDEDDFDPFLWTDQDYSNEAKAYQVLKSFQGMAIPKYYGSYTCQFPALDRNQRSVWLILMEFIPGSSLRDLKPADFSQLERKEIWRQVIDAESAFFALDVTHEDLHPRNILLSVNTTNKFRFRAVINDFGRLRFTRYPPFHEPQPIDTLFSKTYITPLLRWHKDH